MDWLSHEALNDRKNTIKLNLWVTIDQGHNLTCICHNPVKFHYPLCGKNWSRRIFFKVLSLLKHLLLMYRQPQQITSSNFFNISIYGHKYRQQKRESKLHSEEKIVPVPYLKEWNWISEKSVPIFIYVYVTTAKSL